MAGAPRIVVVLVSAMLSLTVAAVLAMLFFSSGEQGVRAASPGSSFLDGIARQFAGHEAPVSVERRQYEVLLDDGVSSADDDDDGGLAAQHATAAPRKAVILTFDDGWQSQYTEGVPVLDRFGFKGTFFIVCSTVGHGGFMSWEEIEALERKGHDVQSHSVNHGDLNAMTASELDYELGRSKECLQEHGINATAFAVPFNNAQGNATVIEAISRYYDFAKNGNTEFPADDGGSPFSEGRYSIKAWSHEHHGGMQQHDNDNDNDSNSKTAMLQKFVQMLNGAKKDAGQAIAAGNASTVDVVAVLEYRGIGNGSGAGASVSAELFLAEMQYLHDNGFAVVTMDDLLYDGEQVYVNFNVPGSGGAPFRP